MPPRRPLHACPRRGYAHTFAFAGRPSSRRAAPTTLLGLDAARCPGAAQFAPALVARELTKMFEECRTGSAEELLEHYEAHPPKGEIVLLVGPPPEVEHDAEDADAMLRELLETEKASRAAAQVAKATGLDRKMLYARAMELKGQ